MKVINDNGETVKAGCVVVNDKREVLLVTNKDLNLWIFPKGHAEVGEALEEVALRETLEETGYEVKITKRLQDVAFERGKTQTGEPIRIAMFLAEPIRLTDKVPEEEFAWMSVGKAREIIYPKLAFYLEGIV